MNDSKSIKILEHVLTELKEIRADSKEIRNDVNAIKIEQGKVAVKLWIVYVIAGAIGLEVIAGLGYLVKQWVEK